MSKNRQLIQICQTSHVNRKSCCRWTRRIWSGIRIQCVTSALCVPPLPAEPTALLTAPQAQTDCCLNSAVEQRIRHNQLPSEAHFDE